MGQSRGVMPSGYFFGEQGMVVVTDQELDGGGIGVVKGTEVQWKAEFNVSDVQDVPLLGIQLAKVDMLSSTSTGAAIAARANAVHPSSS